MRLGPGITSIQVVGVGARCRGDHDCISTDKSIIRGEHHGNDGEMGVACRVCVDVCRRLSLSER